MGWLDLDIPLPHILEADISLIRNSISTLKLRRMVIGAVRVLHRDKHMDGAYIIMGNVI